MPRSGCRRETSSEGGAEDTRLKLVFFGTPEFAVPSLAALDESPHQVVGVVSQPDRPRGRGRRTEPTPVRVEAERRGLALLQPEKVGAAEALDWLRALAPDIGCVVAFGQFIPKPVRTLPPHGLINAHASLLPRYRGAAPIAHAILAGDPTTGISVMKVEREMDAGDVCLVRELAIGDDESTGALEERLAQLAAPALVAACDDIAAGRAVFAPQDQTRATLAPKLGRDFGKLDWSRPRAEVLRRIRAATPRPGADVELAPSGRRFRILAAAAAEGPAAAPRQVDAAESRLRLRAIDGWIEVHRLQAPGKRPVATAEYLRGARVGEDEEIASA